MKSINGLLGVLAGVAAGALIGMAFAPQKGSKMRRNVLHKGENYLDDIKDKFEDFLDNATRKIESKWQNAEDLVNKGKTKYDGATKEVK